MISLGARGAASPAEAVSASEVGIVCVRGYSVVNELFGEEAATSPLQGKTVIQLGNGTPTEVADAAAWFTDRGASYLDGSIMVFPEHVGTTECRVLVSGDLSAFERCSAMFASIGGDVRYLGEDPTASAVVNSSGLAFVYAASHAFLSAAAICDASGAPLDLLADVVGEFSAQMPPLFDEYVEMIATRAYDSKNLRLASGAENLEAIIEFGQGTGVDTDLFESAHRAFQAAADQNRGINLAATFEIVRKPDT